MYDIFCNKGKSETKAAANSLSSAAVHFNLHRSNVDVIRYACKAEDLYIKLNIISNDRTRNLIILAGIYVDEDNIIELRKILNKINTFNNLDPDDKITVETLWIIIYETDEEYEKLLTSLRLVKRYFRDSKNHNHKFVMMLREAKLLYDLSCFCEAGHITSEIMKDEAIHLLSEKDREQLLILIVKLNKSLINKEFCPLKKINLKLCYNCWKMSMGMGRCSGCDSVYFCNEICQKDKWLEHKEECRQIKSLHQTK